MKSMSFRTDNPLVATEIFTTKPIGEKMTTRFQVDETHFFIENPSKLTLLFIKKIATENPNAIYDVTYKLS